MVVVKTIQLEDNISQIETFDVMFTKLAEFIDADKLDDLKEAIYLREETASTYLGNNIAVPHGRVEDLQSPIIIVGINKNGIDWPTDDDSAKMIAMVCIDKSAVSTYLSLLQKLLKWYKNVTVEDFEDVENLEITLNKILG